MCVCAKSLSHVRLFTTPWTVAHKALLFMGFSRQEYWSGLPCPTPGDLPNPGIESASPVVPALQKDSLPTEPPGKPIWTIGGYKSRQTWILTHTYICRCRYRYSYRNTGTDMQGTSYL